MTQIHLVHEGHRFLNSLRVIGQTLLENLCHGQAFLLDNLPVSYCFDLRDNILGKV